MSITIHSRCGHEVDIYKKPRGENGFYGYCSDCEEDVYKFECEVIK